MKNTKRIIATFLCLILIAACSFTAAAATTPTITLSNVSAMPGDTVTIDISIADNPGIMAMSFCITYDNDAFEYTGYNRGYLSRYTIKDHTDKGQIAFVNDEASDKSDNGVMLSVKFKIKDNAAPGKHTISLANQNRDKHGSRLHNSFSNSNLKYIVPTVKAGSITVGETCENAGHKYGEWQIITPANCTNTGEKKHTCVRCNEHSETAEIPITHDFETEWTVDKAATPTEDGIMSRHCKLCNAVTDTFTFTYKEVEDSQNPDDNTSSDDITSSDNNSSDSPSNNNSSNDDTSNDENQSEESDASSDNQNSKPNSSSDTTTSSSGNSGSNNTPNKKPINNTVGAKNPQSAIENVKDFQDNIKPNLKPNLENNDASSSAQNTDKEDETVSNNTSTETNSNAENSEITNVDNDKTENQTTWTAGGIILFVVSAIISIAIIAMAIILIVRRKKAE